MAIELFFSNRLEALADKFLELLYCDPHADADFLRPLPVVVPNLNLGRWLQLNIACRRNVCMNVAFDFLDSGLWRLLHTLDGGPRPAAALHIDELKLLLLYALQHLPAQDARLAPLRRYLQGGPGTARLWQLSEILARLFSEYALHRADMLARWQVREAVNGPLEACQRQLYLQLQTLKQAGGENGAAPPLTLAEYAARVFASCPKPVRGPLPRVHFFGFSQISELHLGIFARLRPYFKILLYVMNPCREFWEDVRTPAEQRWVRRKSMRRLRILPREEEKGELLAPAAHSLLAAWGKPGRESIRRFCALTDYDFSENYVLDAAPDSVLKALQQDILTLGGARGATAGRRQDDSLQIGACPGIFREVETVYNSILYNLQRDRSLQLTDIAVLVPEMERYKPALESIFNRHPELVAYNLVDTRADTQSFYGQALLALLELVRGKFTRREVFALLLNPCVMQKWGLSAEDLRTWAVWADRLHIFHSFDENERRARGYPEGSGYTWKQGLLRLRLARVLSDPGDVPGAGGAQFRHFKNLVPYTDAAAGDSRLLELFCECIETLHRGVQRLKGLRASGLRWRDVFFGVCDKLMQVPENAGGEAAVRRALMQAFGHFALYDRLGGDGHVKGVDAAVVTEFVKSTLGAISGGEGEYLTGGVTIAELQPMRPIPFRLIYVLGLEEGSFPGSAPRISLDLRLAKRRIGDVSPPERDRYLFLETLLAARERVYLTYVARDLQKDRELMPGSVVRQLCRHLEKHILAPGRPFAVTDIALKGSDAVLAKNSPTGYKGDLGVNFSWADRLAAYRRHGLWEQALLASTPQVREKLERFCPHLEAAAGAEPADDAMRSLTLRRVRAFLVDPADYAMRWNLGLFEAEPAVEEITAVEDEPVSTPFPADFRLLGDPLAWWLEKALGESADADPAGLSAGDFFEGYYDHLARQGMTPEALYAELDRGALKAQLLQRAGLLEALVDDMRAAARVYRAAVIGDPGSRLPAGGRLGVKRFDALDLPVARNLPSGRPGGSGIRLHGEQPWLWRSQKGGWHTLVLTGANRRSQAPTRYVVEAVLFYMACLAAAPGRRWLGRGTFSVHVVYNTCRRIFTYDIAPQDARDYLAARAAELLDLQAVDWMPFEVAARMEDLLTAPARKLQPGDRRRFREWLVDAFEKADADYLTRKAVPTIGTDVLETARARLGIFFDTVDRRSA